MKIALIYLLLIIPLSISYLNAQEQFNLKVGDILFQDLDCGPLCDAIEDVTINENGNRFSHVATIASINNELIIIEAIYAGVVFTSLSDFFKRSLDKDGRPKVIVGRIKDDFAHLIPAAVEYVKSLKIKPYDVVFSINNNAYYCSELIYEMYLRANLDSPIFNLHPMTFKIKGSDQFHPAWVEYFQTYNSPIPEGELGISPALIFESEVIDIVHNYQL